MTMWEDSQVGDKPMSATQKLLFGTLGLRGGARFGTRPLVSPRVLSNEAARSAATRFRAGYRLPPNSLLGKAPTAFQVGSSGSTVATTPARALGGAGRAGAFTKSLGNAGTALVIEDFVSGLAGYPGVVDSVGDLVFNDLGRGVYGNEDDPSSYRRNSAYNLATELVGLFNGDGDGYFNILDRIAANDEAASVDDLRRGMEAAGMDPANMFDMNEFRWNMQFDGVLDPLTINAYRQDFETRISKGEDFSSTREDIQAQMMAEAQAVIDYNNTPAHERTMAIARQMREEYAAEQQAAAEEWARSEQQLVSDWVARQLAELARLNSGAVSSINSTGAEYATSTGNNWNSYGDTLSGLAGQVRNAGANSQYAINDAAAAALAELQQQGLDTQGVSDAVAAGIARNETINDAYGGMLDAFGTNGRGYGAQRSNIYDRITQAALAQAQDNRMRQQFAVESAGFDQQAEIRRAAEEWRRAIAQEGQQWEMGMMDQIIQGQIDAQGQGPGWVNAEPTADQYLNSPEVPEESKQNIVNAVTRLNSGESPDAVLNDYIYRDPYVQAFFAEFGPQYMDAKYNK